jgi:uncharacterized paraquat-inducible protein A
MEKTSIILLYVANTLPISQIGNNGKPINYSTDKEDIIA